MFHTNYTNVFREFICDEGCRENGSCPGHKIELIINNTVGVALMQVDGDRVCSFDCNEARALYGMFKQISKVQFSPKKSIKL